MWRAAIFVHVLATWKRSIALAYFVHEVFYCLRAMSGFLFKRVSHGSINPPRNLHASELNGWRLIH